MDALVYTMDGQEYEMLSGILKEESPGLTVSRGVVDREFHLERKYDVVVVGINGALGMELVCKYRELYGNTLVIWITDDPYFANVAIRAHIFDFIVRPFQGARFREPLKRMQAGDIAVWQKIPVKTSACQGGYNCKGNVLERRNGTIWKRIREYFLSENTL